MEVTLEDINSHPLIKKLIQDTWYNGFVRIHPFNTIFPDCFPPYIDEIRSFEVREDDIWITSFPKSGTTWTQEMVWSIINMGKSEYEVEKRKTLMERFPMMEQTSIVAKPYDPNDPEFPHTFEQVRNLPRTEPRLIKSHLSYEMLPREIETKKPKLIHIARNPRDVCVSFYHFSTIFMGYAGTLEDMAELWVNDMLGFYCPILGGVLSYWKRKEQENILFLMYEDVKKDLPKAIKRVAKFLGKELTAEDVSILSDNLTFEKMADNPACNMRSFIDAINSAQGFDTPQHVRFMRKGVVGDWKNHFDKDLIEKFKTWEESWLLGSGMEFQFE